MSNHLAGSASPYLLQHQNNPVDWHPWGEEALARARDENKPLIISIGYSACHWCHVMEKESFEDEGIAAIMNEQFICIKVDREERPDLDHLYMMAVQMITGQGGWPLNVFALPDGRPFYGGTYFRPGQWKSLVQQIAALYTSDYQTLVKQAREIASGLGATNNIPLPENNDLPSRELLDTVFKRYAATFDPDHGGNAGAPKFPLPSNLESLLMYTVISRDETMAGHLRLTLRKMAEGGIYDHVGGGFARYSVDSAWHIPHFEKMLYDNAQLISVYARAYHHLGEDVYLQTALHTLAFTERELQQENGLFSCALDADSEGVEGKFYVWTEEELQMILDDDYPLFSRIFGTDEHSVWEEGKLVLRLVPGYEEVLKAFEGDGQVAIRQGLEKLRLERERRPRPALDDKVLTSWNAMMISAYTDVYRATQERRWLEKAERLASRIRTEMDDGQQGICHAWKDGKAYIPGFLEDYAQMALACIGLHQAGMDERWLYLAKRYADRAIELFLDERTGLFWFSREDDATLVERKIETLDTVTPSSNAVMARVLINLGRLFEDHDLLAAGLRALNAITEHLSRFPTAHMAWAGVLADYHAPLRTLFISGPQAADWAQTLLELNHPFLLVAIDTGNSMIPHLQARREASKTRGYLCTFTECLEPSDTIGSLMELLRNKSE
jgi:uncharacterized protein YyaL (SSP411 family)